METLQPQPEMVAQKHPDRSGSSCKQPCTRGKHQIVETARSWMWMRPERSQTTVFTSETIRTALTHGRPAGFDQRFTHSFVYRSREVLGCGETHNFPDYSIEMPKVKDFESKIKNIFSP
jgi:hypothetical protein